MLQIYLLECFFIFCDTAYIINKYKNIILIINTGVEKEDAHSPQSISQKDYCHPNPFNPRTDVFLLF